MHSNPSIIWTHLKSIRFLGAYVHNIDPIQPIVHVHRSD